jgi:1-acyl-sn-glycerol-3-phosphate acyltransferase
MVPLQRQLAGEGGAVLEGRDIGSVVLPDADVKVFLTASVDERARRRFVELGGEKSGKTLDEMRADIERRDRLDSSREISPLKVPVGAHVLDTTGLSIDEQVSKVADIARETASLLCERALDARDKDPGARRRPSYSLACLVIRFLGVVFFGLRVVRLSRPRYAENYIYASNHRSNADPPIVGATVDREVHYMAKENLFRSRFLSRLITHYNAIPTRRGIFDRNAFQRAEDVLKRGGSLLIFPEGTRIRGADLGQAKPGVGFLALRTRVPVVPIYVEGTRSLKECLLRRTRLTVVRGRPIRVQSEETAAPTADNCREFGSMVMAAIGAVRDEARRAGDL